MTKSWIPKNNFIIHVRITNCINQWFKKMKYKHEKTFFFSLKKLNDSRPDKIVTYHLWTETNSFDKIGNKITDCSLDYHQLYITGIISSVIINIIQFLVIVFFLYSIYMCICNMSNGYV